MGTFRILGIAVAALLALSGVAQAKPASQQAHVQLLAINDLHGHLQPNTPGSIQVGCCNPVFGTGPTRPSRPAGRRRPSRPAASPYLATHIKTPARDHPHTITVGAGDMIGASPLVSALFHDEPTIEELNSLGMDVTGVGNHEFDEGIDELHRMRTATSSAATAATPTTAARTARPFAARSSRTSPRTCSIAGTDETIFPPYEIRGVGGVKIAFIGLTFEGTPTVVTPSGVAGLEFAA